MSDRLELKALQLETAFKEDLLRVRGYGRELQRQELRYRDVDRSIRTRMKTAGNVNAEPGNFRLQLQKVRYLRSEVDRSSTQLRSLGESIGSLRAEKIQIYQKALQRSSSLRLIRGKIRSKARKQRDRVEQSIVNDALQSLMTEARLADPFAVEGSGTFSSIQHQRSPGLEFEVARVESEESVTPESIGEACLPESEHEHGGEALSAEAGNDQSSFKGNEGKRHDSLPLPGKDLSQAMSVSNLEFPALASGAGIRSDVGWSQAITGTIQKVLSWKHQGSSGISIQLSSGKQGVELSIERGSTGTISIIVNVAQAHDYARIKSERTEIVRLLEESGVVVGAFRIQYRGRGKKWESR